MLRLLALMPLFFLLPACDGVSDLLLGDGGVEELIPEPPTAEYKTLDLESRPSNDQLAAYFCDDLAPNVLVRQGCSLFFDDPPAKADLKFSFVIVFDLGNPNGFPVPMVEMLLALDVFKGQDKAELAAVCVSFCDPEQEDCEAPMDACAGPEEGEARRIEDFRPTLDDLVELARSAISGELFDDDNWKFRIIPARSAQACVPKADCEDETCGIEPAAGCTVGPDGEGNTCELCPGTLSARIQFDLGLDAMLRILEKVALESLDALLEGDTPMFDIPWGATGTLFFDVPVLGRFTLDFGPVEGVWSLD